MAVRHAVIGVSQLPHQSLLVSSSTPIVEQRSLLCQRGTFQNSTLRVLSVLTPNCSVTRYSPWFSWAQRSQISLASAICRPRWYCHRWHRTFSWVGMWRRGWACKTLRPPCHLLALHLQTTYSGDDVIQEIRWRKVGSVMLTWLQGNPRITKFWSLYFKYKSWSPLYCGVNPLKGVVSFKRLTEYLR